MNRGTGLTIMAAAILASFACQSQAIVGLTANDEAALRQALDIEMKAANAGTYSMTFSIPGVPVPIDEQGKFLQIHRKQSDGSWKVTREIYNSDLPLPTPAPAPSPDK